MRGNPKLSVDFRFFSISKWSFSNDRIVFAKLIEPVYWHRVS